MTITSQEKICLAISAALFLAAALLFFFGGFAETCYAIILFGAGAYFFVKTFLGPFMASYVGGGLADDIHFPSTGQAAPKEYPEIRAKIAKAEYEDAIKELMGIRAREPANYIVLNMLTDLLADEMKDYERAFLLVEYHLRKKGRTAQDAGLVLKLVDVFLAAGRGDKAVELLDREFSKGYPEGETDRLRVRLEALKGA